MSDLQPVLYVYANPNPMRLRIDDCVVRALSLATDQSWDEVFQDLCALAARLKRMPNDCNVYRTYLQNAGFTRTPVSYQKGFKRPTVASFTQDHPRGAYVLEINKHVVAVRDGRYLDIWDCGEKCLYGILSKDHAAV